MKDMGTLEKLQVWDIRPVYAGYNEVDQRSVSMYRGRGDLISLWDLGELLGLGG